MVEVTDNLIGLTTQIVAAHVSHNTVASDQLPALIKKVYDTLGGVARTVAEPAVPVPVVPIKHAVRPESVTCLDCGGKYKMLKRHLMSEHGMTPEQYRQKWQLPRTYPMVAPNYAKTRSTLAKQIGLGTLRTDTNNKGRKRKAIT